MNKLFIDKTIELNASAIKVWDILTKSEYTDKWVRYFLEGMRLESAWKLGDLVNWKQADGKIVVEGNITSVDPGKFLRFTVFDVEMGRYSVTEEDGITFQLSEENGKTKLHLLHGDFAIMPESKKYYDMTNDAWNKILPEIKELAEK